MTVFDVTDALEGVRRLNHDPACTFTREWLQQFFRNQVVDAREVDGRFLVWVEAEHVPNPGYPPSKVI